MSKPLKKSSKIILGVLLAAVLIGACFGSVALYAKKEMNKPTFSFPDKIVEESKSPLPKERETLSAYINKLYDNALSASDAEGSRHISVNLDGDIKAPLSDSDIGILSYIRDNASPEIESLYESTDSVIMINDENAPRFKISPDDIIHYTATQGRENDKGETEEPDYYFISLEIENRVLDVDSMYKSEVYYEIMNKLTSYASFKDVKIIPKSYTAQFKIDRVKDRIVSAEFDKQFTVKARARFIDKLNKIVLPDETDEDGYFEIEIPYKTSERLSLKWYGARFTTRQIAVKPGDMKALPADVKVNSQASKEDYTLKFDISDDDVISIDSDGVMTVKKESSQPVTITMTLDYNGKQYTDSLIVYITELEVGDDE